MNLQLGKLILQLSFFISISSITSTYSMASTCGHEEGSFKCVEFVRNLDGDTFVGDIPGVHNFFGSDIGIRVRGINTGEVRNYSGKTKCEHEMAILAKAELSRMLERANVIELRETERGKYFRVLADVYINRRSVAKHMLKKSLAVEYDGGYKGGTDWCKLKREAEKKYIEENSL